MKIGMCSKLFGYREGLTYKEWSNFFRILASIVGKKYEKIENIDEKRKYWNAFENTVKISDLLSLKNGIVTDKEYNEMTSFFKTNVLYYPNALHLLSEDEIKKVEDAAREKEEVEKKESMELVKEEVKKVIEEAKEQKITEEAEKILENKKILYVLAAVLVLVIIIKL